jgi:hypothetical protein
MATLTHAYKPNLARMAFVKKRDEVIESLVPRPCMVVSVGLILAGLGIPFLMLLQLLPVTFLLCFSGFTLTMAGSALTLSLCGEI